LTVDQINGYEPATGAGFVVVSFVSESGTFAALGGDGALFTAAYDPAEVTLVRS
jgi:hypothetical protein